MSIRLVALLGILFLELALLMPSPARAADPVPFYKGEYGEIRLLPGECEHAATVSAIKGQLGEDPAEYHKASVIYQGKAYDACWSLREQRVVCVVAGELGHADLPLTAFKKEEAI
jgi:hypothetical protein